MRVRVSLEAEADVAQAFTWYSERATALGVDFLDCFDSMIQQVERFSELAPVVHPPFRRALLHRFPYGVFYSIENEVAVVVGCFHAHRDPDAWRLRTIGK